MCSHVRNGRHFVVSCRDRTLVYTAPFLMRHHYRPFNKKILKKKGTMTKTKKNILLRSGYTLRD